MKRILQIGNGLAFGLTVFINYLSNTGLLNNTTIGEVSDGYKSMFTPAGYTFAIWGIIYLFLFGFAIFQGRSLYSKVKDDSFVLNIGWWFILSCVFNSLWVFAWIYEYTGLSCVLIFLLLFSLFKIIWNNNMQLELINFPTAFFVWLPFAIYSGWVTVASVANMSAYLMKIGWTGFGISASVWTMIMISIAVILNILVSKKRRMIAFSLVGVWALVGIGNANSGFHDTISNTAFIGAIVLMISSVIIGYANRSDSLFSKFRKWRVNTN